MCLKSLKPNIRHYPNGPANNRLNRNNRNNPHNMRVFSCAVDSKQGRPQARLGRSAGRTGQDNTGCAGCCSDHDCAGYRSDTTVLDGVQITTVLDMLFRSRLYWICCSSINDTECDGCRSDHDCAGCAGCRLMHGYSELCGSAWL